MIASSLSFRPDPSFWRGKRVLVTGHTGFKGSWLLLWLARLGAEVSGLGLEPSSSPNLFGLAKIKNLTAAHCIADICDHDNLRQFIDRVRPEIVLHLAAQALVLPGYADPLSTFSTNVMGSACLLDVLREFDELRVAVMITTDKVYENPEVGYPFRETDPLGGHDPYSASKAASEIVISSYRKSFYAPKGVAVATARAGNVIGGGDWANHRLIPDAIRAWQQNTAIQVRRPNAIRPWQHVLEPLSGYLCLVERLWANAELADGYNFGPNSQDTASVQTVLQLAGSAYGHGEISCVTEPDIVHEATFLSLETSRARNCLGWTPKWNLHECVNRTVTWYRQLSAGSDAALLCSIDIEAFEADSLSIGTL